MGNSVKFKLAVEVEKTRDRLTGSDHYSVVVEGNGFRGDGNSYSVGSAFEDAYKDMVARLIEGTAGEVGHGG